MQKYGYWTDSIGSFWGQDSIYDGHTGKPSHW